MSPSEEYRKLQHLEQVASTIPVREALLDAIRNRKLQVARRMIFPVRHRTYISEKPDIVQVITRYTVLKKRGHTYRGTCPIHNGENPTSLSVNPEQGLFYCFSCGRGGDVFSFLSAVENRSITEIIRSHT